MTPKEYQEQAERTEAHPLPAFKRQGLKNCRIDHGIVGLISEVGELATLYKKLIFYGKGEVSLKEDMADELGDCLWYIALIANALNLDLDQVMKANIAKLKVRFPDKFDSDLTGDARDKNKEREAQQ